MKCFRSIDFPLVVLLPAVVLPLQLNFRGGFFLDSWDLAFLAGSLFGLWKSSEEQRGKAGWISFGASFLFRGVSNG